MKPTTRLLIFSQDVFLNKTIMESEEQTNQNPEAATAKKAKDENSEKLVETSNKVKNESSGKAEEQVQIGDELKKEIVSLIADTKKVSLKKAAVKKEKPVASEIQDKEVTKPEKSKPTKSSKKATAESELQPKEKAGKKKEKVLKSQISKSEKAEIISLFKDDLHKQLAESDSSDEDDEVLEPSEDDIDFEHLNKQELVELLEETVEEKDITKIRSQVARIKSNFYQRNREEIESEKQNFIAEGGNEEEFSHSPDPLEQRFTAAFGIYKHNKANYAELLEKEKQENYQLKLKILDELKELIDSEETLKKTYDEFNRLQTTWREIGMVPATELNDLWQNYHFLVERFFDKIRINKELRDLDLKKNLELKVVLCEKAEELILEKSILKSFKLLQKYHDEWREVGPVPIEEKEPIWERFKNASDKINSRRKDYYKSLQEEQQTNYDAKVALCEKAEELLTKPTVSLNDWQKRTKEINEIFKVWKTIGRAPKAQNDEIWARFKVSLDSFFDSKREFLGKLKDQQLNNLNLKIDLCAQAESLKDSEDWRNTTKDLIKLQQEWKKIGPVPRRHSDKIWKRFRTACDHFFNRKSFHFKNLHVVEDENLKKKKELIKEISEFKLTPKKDANMEAIRNFQRQWMEIGHVPYKIKDEIQHQYRDAIDKLFDKMDVSKTEMTKAGFQSKVDMLKSSPDADRRLSKERFHLVNKVTKIKEDVALLENNIGFFANSKQSELLRREFEQKIERAKKEIVEIEAQIQILDRE
ncbi:MAG TPA: DUF349 domain-containing protein [Bacteroidales bacterium]